MSEAGSEALHEVTEGLPEEWIPVHEAAKRLKISERAVYLRLKTGTIPRKQDGRRVLVSVPLAESLYEVSEAIPEDFTKQSAELHEESEAVHEVTEAGNEAERAALLDTIARQDSEIQFLRERVTEGEHNHAEEIRRRDVAEAENRRLWLSDRQELAELRQRLAILPAAPVSGPLDASGASSGKETAGTEKTAGNATEKRHWWERWRKG